MPQFTYLQNGYKHSDPLMGLLQGISEFFYVTVADSVPGGTLIAIPVIPESPSLLASPGYAID